MTLIELYIQEVTRRLPLKMREDIAMELRSTIEDMLPEDFIEEDIKNILSQLGNPATLAAQYKDKPMHIIGPKFYDLYKTVLKIVLLAAPIGMLIGFFITEIEAVSTSDNFFSLTISSLGEGLSIALNTAIQAFFWVTIIFTILDKTISPNVQTPLNWSGKQWSPDDLNNIAFLPHQKAIKNSEIIASFTWTIIWALLYFNAAHLIGVYESSSIQDGLQFKLPVFNQDVLQSYWPLIVLLIIIELAFTLYKARARIWTRKLAVFNTLFQLVSAILTIIIISNPNLLNPDFITYMATLFDFSSTQADLIMTRIMYGVLLSIVVIGLFETITGFLKAKN